MKLFLLIFIFCILNFKIGANAQKKSKNGVWTLALNEHLILSSETNKSGATVNLSRKDLKHSDTLILTKIIAGLNAENRESVLIVKFEDKQIYEFKNINKGVAFKGYVSLHKILTAMNSNKDRQYDLYFLIPDDLSQKNIPLLIARIKLQ